MRVFPLAARFLAAAIAALACAATAQTKSKQEEAVDLILKATREVCAELPRTSSTTKIELNAKAAAELQGLVKKLADLGVGAAASFSKSESVRGLLESDMLPAMTDQNKCRLHVFDKLESKLLSPAPAAKTKVSLYCVFPKPLDEQRWVDFDDADRSYIEVDGNRIPDKRKYFESTETRDVQEHGPTKVGWCKSRDGKVVECYTINRQSARIYYGAPQKTPEAEGKCEPYTPAPVQRKF